MAEPKRVVDSPPSRRYDDVSEKVADLDSVAINPLAHKLLKQLLDENKTLREIMRKSANDVEAIVGMKSG